MVPRSAPRPTMKPLKGIGLIGKNALYYKNDNCTCHMKQNKKPYNKIDHSHCWEYRTSPCGIKGKHRCCLCSEPVPESPKDSNVPGWEKEFDAKVKELKDQRPIEHRDSEPVEFGFSADFGEEIYRVVDFGNIKKFISRIIASETAKERANGAREERQFILNVLDGIDQADKEMGNTGGGTKAIRFALKSRFIPDGSSNSN